MLRFQITLPQGQSKSKPLLHRPCKNPGKLQHVQVVLTEEPCKVTILGPAFNIFGFFLERAEET